MNEKQEGYMNVRCEKIILVIGLFPIATPHSHVKSQWLLRWNTYVHAQAVIKDCCILQP